MPCCSLIKTRIRRSLYTDVRATLLLILILLIVANIFLAKLQRDCTTAETGGASKIHTLKGSDTWRNIKSYNKREHLNRAATLVTESLSNKKPQYEHLFESMFREKEKTPFENGKQKNRIQQFGPSELTNVRVTTNGTEGLTDRLINGRHSGPVVWIWKGDRPQMAHVRCVFERLGFTVITSNASGHWDVLWTRDYDPLTWPSVMNNLKPHQKINHFPGTGFVTEKTILSKLDHPAIPKSFVLPWEKSKFTKYTEQNPNKLWLKKGPTHRGIALVNVKEFNMKANETIAQEFIDNPLLLNGRKFDIGLYTIVTSLDPLRIYTGSLSFRCCKKDYYPFDASDQDKYIIEGHNNTPVHELPSVRHMYTNELLSEKAIVETYFQSQGKDLAKVWAQMDEIIRKIYLIQNPHMRKESLKFNATSSQFFELVRCDFIIDDDLGVHLMEVNLSPSLATRKRNPQRQLLYEQATYNTLRLAGVATMLDNHFHNSDAETVEMQVSDKDIAVFPEWCTRESCKECSSKECKVCISCVSADTRQVFKDAYLEHVNRGSCRRIFPPKLSHAEALDWHPSKDIFHLTQYQPSVQRLFVWFIGMCRKDPTFCQ